jgi:hypothetical protein
MFQENSQDSQNKTSHGQTSLMQSKLQQLYHSSLLLSSLEKALTLVGINPIDYILDGGTVINLDIDGAFKRCKEIVDDEADIIIDVFFCSGGKQFL